MCHALVQGSGGINNIWLHEVLGDKLNIFNQTLVKIAQKDKDYD